MYEATIETNTLHRAQKGDVARQTIAGRTAIVRIKSMPCRAVLAKGRVAPAGAPMLFATLAFAAFAAIAGTSPAAAASNLAATSAAPEPMRVAAARRAKPAEAEASRPEPSLSPCVTRYHQSLQAIAAANAENENAAASVSAAAGDEFRLDPLLPGLLIIPPQPRQRTRAEVAVLNVASALARSKGLSASSLAAPSTDRTWIAERLRGNIADYLAQKPSPYLCNGVEAYLATMSGYAEQLGPSAERQTSRIETAKTSAEKALADANAALDALPPTDPKVAALAELRPAAGIVRREPQAGAPTTSGTAGAAPANAPPVETPAVSAPATLDTEKGRAAAVDGLIAKAKAKGMLRTARDSIDNNGGTAGDDDRSVLDRLAAIKPALLGPRAAAPVDRKLLRVLATAFSEIELLDYVARAGDEPIDPVGAGIHATIAAIRDAQKRDCTCAP